jgi:hypothetical protein
MRTGEIEKYFVSEQYCRIKNYHPTVSELIEFDDNLSGYTITNSYTPPSSNLIISKKWDDKLNLYGTRPKYVNFKIYKNGIIYDELRYKMNQDSYQMMIPLYDDNGDKIEWEVKESKIENYISNIEYVELIYPDDPTKNSISALVTNTFVPNKIMKKEILLNGFGIISFNNDFDNSSIKYEYFNFESELKNKLENQEIDVYDEVVIPNNSKENVFLKKYWILLDENDDKNLIITKNEYLDDLNNLLSGPFDTQEEVIVFLTNFFEDDYTITFKE